MFTRAFPAAVTGCVHPKAWYHWLPITATGADGSGGRVRCSLEGMDGLSSIEPKLVQQVMRGDHGALCEVLESQRQRLYNVVLRMVGNRDDAAELTQDVMLKIVEHIGDFKGKSQLTTWMIRIAMNLSVSFLRKQTRRRTASLDQPLVDGGGSGRSATLGATLVDGREPRPDERVERTEAVGRVLAALGRLDEGHRAVLVLRDIDGMDYQQIAAVLATPVGTIKSRLFRARLALRKEVTSMEQGVTGHMDAETDESGQGAASAESRETNR